MAGHKGRTPPSERHHDHPHFHSHRDGDMGHHNEREHGSHHDHREHEGRGASHDGARGAPHEREGNEGRSERGIARGRDYASGRDAAYMEPRLIPDYELLPRDDSGGPEWAPYTQEWGDGGYVTGEKAHLSVRGGRDDEMEDDEVSSEPRSRSAKRAEGERTVSPNGPGSSAKYARE